MAIEIKKSHEGRFHRDVGKKPGEKITDADIEKGLKSKDPAERKRANFARNARKWNHSGKKKAKRSDSERSEKMYGKHESKSYAAKKSDSPRLPKET